MEIELNLRGGIHLTHEFVVNGDVLAALDELSRRVCALEDDMASEQVDVDALTASIAASITAINQHIADIEAQVAAGAQPDLTALKAEVASLATIVPAPPAPGTPPAAPAA